MILVEEAIQLLQSEYSKGLQSKNTRLSSRHIYSAITTARAILIRQMSNSNQRINSDCYHTLPCVELEKVSAAECDLAPTNGCVVLRSKYKLPASITDIQDELISNVMTVDGSTNFDVVDFNTARYQKGNKYTNNLTVVYKRNGYLWVRNRTYLKALTLDGVFQDPIEVHLFKVKSGCSDCECIGAYQIDFAFDREKLTALRQLAEKELVLIFSQMREDKKSNASDDAGGQKIIHQPQG